MAGPLGFLVTVCALACCHGLPRRLRRFLLLSFVCSPIVCNMDTARTGWRWRSAAATAARRLRASGQNRYGIDFLSVAKQKNQDFADTGADDLPTLTLHSSESASFADCGGFGVANASWNRQTLTKSLWEPTWADITEESFFDCDSWPLPGQGDESLEHTASVELVTLSELGSAKSTDTAERVHSVPSTAPDANKFPSQTQLGSPFAGERSSWVDPSRLAPSHISTAGESLSDDEQRLQSERFATLSTTGIAANGGTQLQSVQCSPSAANDSATFEGIVSSKTSAAKISLCLDALIPAGHFCERCTIGIRNDIDLKFRSSKGGFMCYSCAGLTSAERDGSRHLQWFGWPLIEENAW